MWPGFDSQTLRYMWVDFVGSLLCFERFSVGTLVFPFASKTSYVLYDFTCDLFSVVLIISALS